MSNKSEAAKRRQRSQRPPDDGSRNGWMGKQATFAEQTERVIDEMKAEITRAVREAFGSAN